MNAARLRCTLAAAVALAAATTLAGAAWQVEPVAGGGPDNLPALESNLAAPVAVAIDRNGELLILARESGQLLRVDANGSLHRVLQGAAIDSLEGVLYDPLDLAVAPDGSIVVVGEYTGGTWSPDTGWRERPFGLRVSSVAVDSMGRVYFLEPANVQGLSDIVRRYDPADGTTVAVAGKYCVPPFGIPQFCNFAPAEGAPALDVRLAPSAGLAVDAAGNLYIAERSAARVRRVDAADGRIWTVAGTGTPGDAGDGGPALAAGLRFPSDVVLDGSGGLLIADTGNNRVRRVDLATRIITTVAGDGQGGFSGDGAPAIEARLFAPSGLALDSAGNLFIADYSNLRVRRVDAATGRISTVAGNGTLYFSGDGYPAAWASISQYSSFVADGHGNLWIADSENHRIRRIDAETGIISTIAGNGDSTGGAQDDGVPATEAVIPYPGDPIFDPQGNLYFYTDGRLRRIDAETGLISTVLPEVSASIAVDHAGTIYQGGRGGVFTLDPATGEFHRVAGNGDDEYNGEHIPALEAGMFASAIFFDPAGDLYFTDVLGGRRVRRIHAGFVETVVGGGGWDRPGIGEAGVDTVPALGSFQEGYGAGVDAAGHVWILISGGLAARLDLSTGVLTRIFGWSYSPGGGPRPPIDSHADRLYAQELAYGSDGTIYVKSRGRFFAARDTGTAPIAVPWAPAAVACVGAAGATVTLDGSLSYDPDDEPGGESQIAAYWWYEDHGTPQQRIIAKGPVVDVRLPIGTHRITLLVRDTSAFRGTQDIQVEIRDDEDPDGDGFASCVDNCPDVPNADQADLDGNGLGDPCDPCSGGSPDDEDADTVCSDVDNCATVANPDQADADGDGYGDACDLCPLLPNPAQGEHATCVQETGASGTCRAIATDATGMGRRGRLLLGGVTRPAPTSLRFGVLHTTPQSGDVFEFHLNGVLVGSAAAVPGPSPNPLIPQYREVVISDPGSIASIWIAGLPNELRFVKTGTRTAVHWVRLSLANGTSFAQSECLYDAANRDCSGYSAEPGAVDATKEVEYGYAVETPIAEVTYGPQPPAATIDVESPFAEYRLCVSATRDDAPQALCGGTSRGELIEIDPFSGRAELRGDLSVASDSFDYDLRSGTVLAIAGSYPSILARFDIRDGSPIGRLQALQHDDVVVLEHTAAGVRAARALDVGEFPEDEWLTEVFDLDPETGGRTGYWWETLLDGYPGGLAYDAIEHVLWACQKSSRLTSRCTLKRVDLTTYEVRTVGSPGLDFMRIQVGPDGLLYAVTRGGPDGLPGKLYYIDPDTARPTEIGDTGFDSINVLTLVGPQGGVDCVRFDARGEERLAINASCGPPRAVIAPVADTACDSPAGGVVLLDGSASEDPNSDAGAGAPAVGLTYEWYEDHDTPAERHLGSGALLEVALSTGSHAVTLRVANRFGEAATAATTVTVIDDEAPTLALAATPALLWPPNHRMVEVALGIDARDNCGAPAVRLIEARSNEPDDAPGGGDGQTTGDIEGAEPGAADTVVGLRAERAGDGAGRVYTLVYEAQDAAAHRTVSTIEVVVPHSQSAAAEPLEVSLENTSQGTLARWTEAAGAQHYDVIRGRLEELRLAGGAVDLGRADCVEAGSLDGTTAGFEDGSDPAPGAGYFYLVEYYDGWQASSYGTETAGRPRQAASGGCR